jgi:parallel beta-helix repeat protein
MNKEADPGATITLGEPIIDGNIITDWPHGIFFNDVDGATVTNNFIMDNNCGILLNGSDNIDILNNDILQNQEATSGVHLDINCGPDTTINYNNIVANTGYGVYNESSNMIDAENNWWGDPSGPDDDAGVINGTGDRISTNVDADPWLTAQSHVCIYEEVTTATASGIASVQTDGGAVSELESVAEGTLPDAGKPDLTFPHGFFSYTIIGLEAGQEVTATLTLPGNMPVGTEYWKYGPTDDDPTDHWYSIPIGDDDGDNVITIPLVDGGLGDNDLTANGTIEEPGAPGYVPPAVEEEEEEVIPRRRAQAATEDEEPTGIARFNVTNLYVTPSEVPPDQIVNVSADVTNIGSERGSYDAILYVNGEKQGGHTVHLYPGVSQRVLFQVARPTPGTYRVSVANQSGWFTVNDTEFNVVVLPPEADSGGLGTPAIIAIVLGSVAVGVGIYFARRRSTY